MQDAGWSGAEIPPFRLLQNTQNVISNGVRNLLTSIKSIDLLLKDPRNDRKNTILQHPALREYRLPVTDYRLLDEGMIKFLYPASSIYLNNTFPNKSGL
jgi:hypothetical protein